MSFNDYKLNKQILENISLLKYNEPTRIQKDAIPIVLNKENLLGLAQTGTGKTAAFLLPIIHNFIKDDYKNRKKPKILIIAPTRDLINQLYESFLAYSKNLGIRGLCIYGGCGYGHQLKSLQKGVDFIFANTGRLLDLVVNRRVLDLSEVNTFVLDEADQMLDMGFIPDIDKICTLLKNKKQVLMFSATMPPEIKKLVKKFFIGEYKTVKMETKTNINNAVKQIAYLVRKEEKPKLLIEIIKSIKSDQIIIFTKTRLEVKAIHGLLRCNKFSVDSLHSDKSQSARKYALDNFKKNKTQILVATNIAARGIDVNALGVVINYNLPEQKETYVHRIGRSGRAGNKGLAISLCTKNELRLLAQIEKIMETKIEVISHSEWSLKFDITASVADNSIFRIKNDSRRSSNRGHHSKSNSKFERKVKPFSDKKSFSSNSKKSNDKKFAKSPSNLRKPKRYNKNKYQNKHKL